MEQTHTLVFPINDRAKPALTATDKDLVFVLVDDGCHVDVRQDFLFHIEDAVPFDLVDQLFDVFFKKQHARFCKICLRADMWMLLIELGERQMFVKPP